MRRMRVALSLVLGLWGVCPHAVFSKTLNEKIDTDHHDYRIEYRNRNPDDEKWYTSTRNARRIANHFDPDSGVGLHENYVDLGFRAPTFFGFGRNNVKLKPSDITTAGLMRFFPTGLCFHPRGSGIPGMVRWTSRDCALTNSITWFSMNTFPGEHTS